MMPPIMFKLWPHEEKPFNDFYSGDSTLSIPPRGESHDEWTFGRSVFVVALAFVGFYALVSFGNLMGWWQ